MSEIADTPLNDFARGAEAMREALRQSIPDDSDMPWWRIRFEILGRIAVAPEEESAHRIAVAAPDLLAALKAYEALDEQRNTCEECEDSLERAPETCELCFPFADDARLKMRAAIAKAEGRA